MYSDYSGVGPYQIPGSAGAVDLAPASFISEPETITVTTTVTEINEPSDTEDSFGSATPGFKHRSHAGG